MFRRAILGLTLLVLGCSQAVAAPPATDAEAMARLREFFAYVAANPGIPVVTPPVVTPPVVTPPAGQAEAATALANATLPKVVMSDVEVDPSAKFAYVTVRLVDGSGKLQPPTTTAYVEVATQNGSGTNYAWEGGQFSKVTKTLVFPAGGGAQQSVAIPIRGGPEGMWFKLYTPNAGNPGLQIGGAEARITFKKGAVNSEVAFAAPAGRAPQKGALVYAFDPSTFKAAANASAGIASNQFMHGREQTGNKELGYYSDAAQGLGTTPWSIRDGILTLRVEKLAKPFVVGEVGKGGTAYDYSSSVIRLNFLSQTYGYYEFEAQDASARGVWSGLWLLPSNNAWPPEIDVMEGPNNGTVLTGHTTVADHWTPGHRSIGAHIKLNTLPEFAGFDRTTGFHTYAVDWRADYTTWYIDGVEIWRKPTTFHLPAYPLMDLTIGGWGGTPDLSKGTTELKIRSVRVFK